jgi:hypothetical protein
MLFGGPVGSNVVDGRVLREPGWLAEQVEGSLRQWGTRDVRVAAVLWWYSVSTVLPAPSLATWFMAGRPVDPAPESLLLHPGGAGLPVSARARRVLVGTAGTVGTAGGAGLAKPLRELLETCVDGLSEVAGIRPRPLWAVASDSLGNVLLRVGQETGREAEASLAAEELAGLIGDPLPRPRWVDVGAGPDGSPDRPEQAVRFLRRASCCLIYRLPVEAMCVSCPRRAPEDRAARLRATAARLLEG